MASVSSGGAPELGAHAGEELRHGEGFGDVVIRACIEGADLHGFAFANAEDDDGNLGKLANGLGQLDAVHLRHGEICDDQVRLVFAETFEGLNSVVSYRDLIAAALQGGAEHAGDLAFVVDCEDALQWVSLVTMCRST